MRKIIIVLLSLFISSIGYTDTEKTITIINNGKAGGSYNARTQMYKQGLMDAGYNVLYEDVGKISQAVKMFKETTQPTIMVYSNNQVHQQKLFHTEENFIILEYQQLMYVCQTFESKGKTDVLTVAHGKGYDKSLIYKTLGDGIILIPYKNSGDMLKGILGGDVDMMINNQGSSLKYENSGKGECEPSQQLPIMQATVIGTNVDVKEIRKILFDITNSEEFTKYHTSNQLDRPSSDWDSELSNVKTLEKQWQE